ncbi:MAG: (Fe-S)-binding protein, partial [Corynebacterium sp.]|nr:(Fe-S)-binding protein [Corynebacterium sp.]
NAETSAAMVADKTANIRATEAEFVTAGDASCLLNIGGALRRQDSGVHAIHMAEILASTKETPFDVHNRQEASLRGEQ